MDKSKCSKCGKCQTTERFRYFELVWKCDLILSEGIWKGILCEECHKAMVQDVKKVIT